MGARYKVLIVDDTEINRSLLSDMLSQEYEIVEAANGVEAMSLLSRMHAELSLVLLDIVMPHMDGFEVLAAMNQSGWLNHLPVIMISAETSSSYIDHAYDLGATDYINRPFDERTVQRRVQNTIMLYSKQKLLEGMVTEQIIEKEKNNYLMIEILSHIVEFRNGESGLHVLHIRIITELLLKRLTKKTDQYSLSPTRIGLIVNASALHDIGKISIPESILNKPGRLTTEEFEQMKTHSAIGAQILSDTPYGQQEELVQLARDICRWHHERYDGRGYPDGLQGEEIPIEAQVVSLADVYDALTSERVYKPAYSHEKAMQMILDGECGLFNPLLLECLSEIGDTLKEEIQVSSLDGGVTQQEAENLTHQLLSHGQVSNRTLALLEQERTKYQFFASMSREIQFEYNVQTDLLSLSEWGASSMGVSELIMHPSKSQEVLSIIEKKDLLDIWDKLCASSPDEPVIAGRYQMKVHGVPQWFKMVARTLWVGEEPSECTGAIGKLTSVNEEQLQMEKFRKMANQDSLTQLHNKASVRGLVESELATQREQRFALLLFDLDYFKSANERGGYIFGNNVLKHVAQQIICSTRKEDIAARIGGDEFLIFIRYEGSAEATVSRIFNTLTSRYNDFDVSISMGVACYPEHGKKYDDLFHSADQALCQAKKNGRSQFYVYQPTSDCFSSVISPVEYGNEGELNGLPQ